MRRHVAKSLLQHGNAQEQQAEAGERIARGRAPGLSGCAQARLLAHAWPGNVRELENVMQRALVLCNGHTVDAAALHIEDRCHAGLTSRGGTEATAGAADRESGNGEAVGLGEEVRNHEEQLILNALRVAQGSRKEAAARLGISPRTLRYKLARMRELGMAIP